MKAKHREAEPAFWTQKEKSLSHWFEICCGLVLLGAQSSNNRHSCAGAAGRKGAVGRAPVPAQATGSEVGTGTLPLGLISLLG